MFVPLKKWIGNICLILTTTSIQAEPLTRYEAIQLALQNNLEITAAHAAWKAERARTLQAWALPAPELQLEYEGLSGAFNLGQYEQRDLGITQRMVFPLKWWQKNRAATHHAQATRLSIYETTRRNITRDVQITYDRTLKEIMILAFSHNHVQLAQTFLQRAQKRFALGDVPKLDVMRAEVALMRLENHRTQAQHAVYLAQSALNILLNQKADTPIVLSDSLNTEILPPNSQTSYFQRSDLQGAEKNLASLKAAQAASVAALVPDISISLSRQTVNSPAGQQKFWRTGFALELPVWALFQQKTDIAEAQARLHQALAERDHLKQRIEQETTAASLTLQGATERMTWMKNHILPTAEAAYHMARRSYEEGKATYLDLLEAQKELVEIQTEYVETLFEYRSAQIQWMHATGQNHIPVETNYGDQP